MEYDEESRDNDQIEKEEGIHVRMTSSTAVNADPR